MSCNMSMIDSLSVTRTPSSWSEFFGTDIRDPDGWRVDGKSFDDPITAMEFACRWISSSCIQPPSSELEALIRASILIHQINHRAKVQDHGSSTIQSNQS